MPIGALSVIGVVATIIITTSAHELGHAAAARLLRIPIRWILIGHGPVLWRRPLKQGVELVWRALPTGIAIGLDGRRNADGTLCRPIRYDMLIAAAGPVVSLLLAALLWDLGQWVLLPSWLRFWLIAGGLLSVVTGILSLIPIPGLDGGHLLMLALTRAGIQISPQQETYVHRLGVNLIFAGSLTGLVATLVYRL